jgi:hypothetical protein
MHHPNRLGQMILEHWQTHHPKMLAELESNHQLEQMLHETQERAGDLLYELISVRKMDYQAAWETVTREWVFPPIERRPPQRSFAASTHRKDDAERCSGLVSTQARTPMFRVPWENGMRRIGASFRFLRPSGRYKSGAAQLTLIFVAVLILAPQTHPTHCIAALRAGLLILASSEKYPLAYGASAQASSVNSFESFQEVREELDPFSLHDAFVNPDLGTGDAGRLEQRLDQ